MKNFIATVSLFIFIALSFCFGTLFASINAGHIFDITNHECCDFVPDYGGIDVDGAIFQVFTVPSVLIAVFSVLLVAFSLFQGLFLGEYSPYLFHKFSKGVIQLE